LFSYIRADIERQFAPEERTAGIPFWRVMQVVLLKPELWVICLYRYGRWAHTRCHSPLLQFFLGIPYLLLHRPLMLLCGVHIPWDADIGKGLFIGHCGSIWIGPVKIGVNCNISQEVTVGIGGRGERRGMPEVGDRVWFGPGAKVFGRIKIGDDVAIGANSVVSKSLPTKAVVLGNPGRIVGHEGSADFIH